VNNACNIDCSGCCDVRAVNEVLRDLHALVLTKLDCLTVGKFRCVTMRLLL
jgi:hypothetical protein